MNRSLMEYFCDVHIILIYFILTFFITEENAQRLHVGLVQ